MRPVISLLAATAVCLAAACSDDTPVGPGAAAPPDAPTAYAAPGGVTVMTRNLYVGTDVDAVIAALATPDGADDLPALIAAIETLRRTDFPSRAAAFAGEIAKARPHVVGLQEVSQIDLTLPPLGVDLHYDFLPTLLGELSARGLDYTVAAQTRNIEAAPLPGVSLVDFDVLLIDRERVTVEAAAGAPFTANLGQVAPGVVLQRGWVSATVTIDGQSYRFASTHPEPGGLPGLDQLRAAQVGELAQILAGDPRAVIMGDLNDVPASPMHQVLTGAGFLDGWAAMRPGTRGYTCCHLVDLSNQVERFTQRIDYIFLRGLGSPPGEAVGRIARVGEVPADRVGGADHRFWPSDHAGLVATLPADPGLRP